MQKKFTLEYSINSSPKILFNYLSTSWGLAEWFADDVQISDQEIFIFFWDQTPQKAKRINNIPHQYVMFQWLDTDEDTYFAFKIHIDDLTNDVALEITDFGDEDETDDVMEIWNSQIDQLRHVIGSY